MSKLYAVGVGPGDPELLTIKAHRVLQEVTTVFVPKPRKENESQALKIAAEYIGKAQVQFLHMPMLNSRDELIIYWEKAAEQVIESLQRGNAAFLTLGDPLTYSTASYLVETIQRIQPAVKVEFIPGITSYNACAARIGKPLVEGNENLVVVPAREQRDYLVEVLKNNDNCILLKVSRGFAMILQVLEDLNLKENAVFISRCGTEQEMVIEDLDKLRGQDIDYFSLIIIKNKRGGC